MLEFKHMKSQKLVKYKTGKKNNPNEKYLNHVF